VNVVFNDALAVDRVVPARRPMEPEATPGMMDESLFQTLYRRTAPSLRAYVAHVLGDASQADDIAQDAYLRLLRSGPATEDPSQLRAFLFRVASNLIIDHWRHRGRERRLRDERAAPPHVPAPDLPLRLDFARVFERLNPQQRQMMWLAYVEGADHREIAAALGLRERSVRVLLYRARHKLARMVEESRRRQGEG
jgi:RNA polymerase sigma-70 factor (ECF subfamily)